MADSKNTYAAQAVHLEDQRDGALTDEIKKSAVLVDTVHGDEAVKLIASYRGPSGWDNAEEKRLIRKIDCRLLGILAASYGLQYYDKAMLSQAVSEPPKMDLHCESRQSSAPPIASRVADPSTTVTGDFRPQRRS